MWLYSALMFLYRMRASERFCKTGKKSWLANREWCDKELWGFDCDHDVTECNWGARGIS